MGGEPSFEEKIRLFMRSQRMYKPGDHVLVGISGGKDSLMLAHVMAYAAQKDEITVELLHLNFGQKGSQVVEQHVVRFAERIGLPLHVWRLEEEWGMGFEELVSRLRRNPCSLCSTLLRYYLLYLGRSFDAVATGHNLDDMVSFFLYNAMTGNTRFSSTLRPVLKTAVGPRKIRPFFYVPEERIAEEAKKRGIVSIPTGCPSEDEAPTVFIRRFLKDVEKRVPGARKSLLRFFLSNSPQPSDPPGRCRYCGMPARGNVCAVCKMKIELGILKV